MELSVNSISCWFVLRHFSSLFVLYSLLLITSISNFLFRNTTAKTGLDVPITNMRFPVSDLLTCVNQLCVKEWQQVWNQCTSNKLYSVQPVIGHNTSSSLSHYDSVLINYLRIGHTRLTNSYLLKGASQPVCEASHSPLTVKHVLVDCTCYSAARARQRYFGVDTLKDLKMLCLAKNVASRDIMGISRHHCFC